MRMFGPKSKGHPTIGAECITCRKDLKEGDYTALVSLGPGDDPKNQEKAREGKAFTAKAIEVHWVCATGEPEPCM